MMETFVDLKKLAESFCCLVKSGQVEAQPCRSRACCYWSRDCVEGRGYGGQCLENSYIGHGEPSGTDKTRAHDDLGNAMNFSYREKSFNFSTVSVIQYFV